MKKNIFYFLSFILILFSCKKAENRKCWKSAGNEVVKIFKSDSFNQLNLKKGITYELVQDSLNYFEIIGGKNLVNFIEINQNNNKIIIENLNKCNFLRKYKNNSIKVVIHFTDLSYIRYEGTENLSNIDTLLFNNLVFESIDACGSSKLIIKANSLEALAPMGNSNFNLFGNVLKLKLDIRDYSYCNTTGLIVENEIEVINESFNDLYINADKLVLKGKIIGAGNIFYIGDILSDEIKTFSSGKTIKIN